MSLPIMPFGDDENEETTPKRRSMPPAPKFPGFAVEEEEHEEEPYEELPAEPTTSTKPTKNFFLDDEEEDTSPTPQQMGTQEELDASYDQPLKLEEYPEEVQESISLILDTIADDESTEVIINGPTAVLYKVGGARYHLPNIYLGDTTTYHQIINDFILDKTNTRDRITPYSSLVEGRLTWHDTPGEPPTMARVNVITPPVVEQAKVTIAKKARNSITIDDIVNFGSMSHEMGEFLKAAAKARVTIVFSGLTGSGKTTLLEAMSYHFDANDRIIVVEDTPELRLPISDTVYMATTPHKPGTDPREIITMEWLVRATNRMRGDRVIVGEIRGAEMSEFLIAANSGADGSLTTLHAANPRMALEKMLSLAMKAEGARNEQTIRREIASTVQLVVQTNRIDGKHVVTNIEEISEIVGNTGVIATQSLFEYDRNSQRHFAAIRPSENLQEYMKQRGVAVENQWFLNSR